MTYDKDHLSSGAGSRDGLRELDEGHLDHGSMAYMPAPHPSGPKFDQTPNEVHRGGALPNEKK